MRFRWIACLTLSLFVSRSAVLFGQQTNDQSPLPSAEQLLKTLPFEQLQTTDSLGRTITFYLSRWPLSAKPKPEDNAKLQPLVVFINGSGAQSIFARFQDKVSTGLQGLMLRIVKGQARVLVVEKAGVQFLDSIEQPGSAIGASQAFLQEHTLDRWTIAHQSAIETAWKLPQIDSSKTLVVGHSEGSNIAACLAKRMKQITHVACLSGGGATQLLSLSQLALKPQAGDKPGDALRRRQAIYDGWAEVQRDPESVSKFWMGHPNRRWSSFLPHQSADDLLRTNAKIYLVHGLSDTSEDPTSHDHSVATLRAAGKPVREELLENADHGFHTPEMPIGSPEGFNQVFERVGQWFLTDQ